MDFDKPKRKNEDTCILYDNMRWTMLVGTVFFFFFAIRSIFLGDVTDIVDYAFVVFILLLFLLALIYLTILYFSTHLIIQPDGLEWVQGGTHFNCTWNETSTFIVIHYRKPERYVVKLKLHSPISPKTDTRLAQIFYGDKIDCIPLSEFVHIPTTVQLSKVQVDKQAFQNTDIGAKLFQYAPHLFEETTVS